MKHAILVVDDDELILNTYKKQFSSWDIEVYAASNPDEARGLLGRLTPELVILDLLLTKDDGSHGILEFIKSTDRLKHIPVLIVTNLDKPELKESLLSEGVKEYLIKGSMSIDELYKKVWSYLEPAEQKQ